MGPVTVHFYALCLLVGMIIAVAVTNRRLVRRGVESGKVIDIALWAIPIAIIGGRLYHVVTHPTDYFAAGDNLWNIFAIWQGGLAIFGSILFGTVGAYIGCRRAGVRFLTFADALAPGMLLAQAFGRLGNYFNQELYGSPTTLPWGLQISTTSPAYPPNTPAGTLFQPLFLYEMIWNIGGALLLIFILERRFSLHRGQAIGFYFLWYGFARAILESMRDDPTEFYFAGLKINEDVAILAAVLGWYSSSSAGGKSPSPRTTPIDKKSPPRLSRGIPRRPAARDASAIEGLLSGITPDLVTLRILTAIGETGTFAEAAARVGMSQQAASSRIRAAERGLGFTLVDRSPKGSALTSDGQLVAEWSAPVIAAADQLGASLRTLRPQSSVVLTVAASQTIAEHFLPGWITQFHHRASPGNSLRLASGNSAFVIDRVRTGESTIGLIETPDVPEDLASATIRDDPLVVVVSPSHPWADRLEPLTPHDLASTPLIVRESGSGTRRTLELALTRVEPELATAEPAAILSTTSAIRAAALTGVAPAVLSAATVEDDIDRGALVPVSTTGLALSRPLTALWSRSIPLPAIAQVFFEVLRS